MLTIFISCLNGGKYLQILICVLAKKDHSYNNLKLISETKVGIVAQCCSFKNAPRTKTQFLTNLALKINVRLGGSNMELFKQPQCLRSKGHVMFIGTEVNHLVSYNSTCPSIVDVVVITN
ncbi:eukaryotic translation initiation factor 2c, putative [Ricinus communis]|uniref:Eukaryotic translation initiation factor 2c, putative n=1 Tax=Ricinus communis TaxID=3988 RepID=B9S0P9_RICCO|nr:eukaryotic translation initiation factor 2c, putative [Ricinus communis]